MTTPVLLAEALTLARESSAAALTFELGDWAVKVATIGLAAFVGVWMASIHRAADRAAISAAEAAKSLVSIQQQLGSLLERTDTQTKVLEQHATKLERIADSTDETAREGQALALIVARQGEALDNLRCQREGVGHT